MASRRILSKQILSLARPRKAVIIIVCSLFLVFLERNNENILKGVRTTVHNLSLPLIEATYAPFGYLGSLFLQTKSLFEIKQEAKDLQKSYQEALSWKMKSQQLMAENHSLRQQLQYKPQNAIEFVSGRVLFTTGHPHQRSLIINIGKAQGIRKNDPVMSKDAIIGRIIQRGAHSSRVLFITDNSSRIPVITKETQIQGIASGFSQGKLKLMHVLSADKVKVGEPIYTTGKGGIFPDNILIGHIDKLEGNVIYVEPAVRMNDVDFVFVLKQREGNTPATRESLKQNNQDMNNAVRKLD